RANTDFPIARKRTRQQEVRHIHARDEQNAARHRAQHEQSRTRVADHRAELRHYFRASVYLLRILLMPTGSDRVDVRLRLLNRNAWLQARNALKEIVVPLLGHRQGAVICRAQDRHRDPKFWRIRKSEGISEARRHHPDHLKLLTVQSDVPPNNPAVAAKLSLPQLVAQNDDMDSRFVLLGKNMRPSIGSTPSSGNKSAETD